ncbi:hypothetical protein QCA50_001436 [Cerrena zonata]|uniref:Uncharacterized protein n=1 Tax=Cerrena zonata TaxID=2478898 RepID=A0AAW0GNC8_9APHY
MSTPLAGSSKSVSRVTSCAVVLSSWWYATIVTNDQLCPDFYKTHNVALTAPVADFVVSLSPDGRIASQGTLSTALAKDEKLSAQMAKESEIIEKVELGVDPEALDKLPKASSDGKLIVDEEIQVGRVSWAAMKLFLTNLSGKWGIWVFWATLLLALISTRVLTNLEIWIIGSWARQYELHDPSEVSAPYYMGLYIAAEFGALLSYGIAYITLAFGSMRVSRIIHRLLISSVFNSTLRWLDRTPVSRIITRCSQDIQEIDGEIPVMMMQWFDVTFIIIVKLVAVVLLSPIFIIPGIVLIIAGVSLGHVYMRAQLPVKRESSNARAPVMGHFGAAVAGLVSIRAYGAQDMFRKELYNRSDRFTRVNRDVWDLNRWISIQTDVLAGIFCASLAAYLIYGGHMDSSSIGFSITMAVGRTGSGKSSLTLALLRCILTEGTVYYDGLPTSSLNLDALRSSVTIIPQVPELLSGTVRQNLDPFSQHDDAILNDALRSAGLFSLQTEDSSGRISLDSQVTGSGSNLSVGQRQILALARAMVRQSKLLILDEATSAIDYETDTVIQTSLRKELSKDVTLLIVAHRLQTIMDADRIMVLDAGHIADFDKPSELLKKEGSLLRALVEESGDKVVLMEMASGSKK